MSRSRWRSSAVFYRGLAYLTEVADAFDLGRTETELGRLDNTHCRFLPGHTGAPVEATRTHRRTGRSNNDSQPSPT